MGTGIMLIPDARSVQKVSSVLLFCMRHSRSPLLAIANFVGTPFDAFTGKTVMATIIYALRTVFSMMNCSYGAMVHFSQPQ